MQNGTDIATSKNKKIKNKKDGSWMLSKQPRKMGLLAKMEQISVPQYDV